VRSVKLSTDKLFKKVSVIVAVFVAVAILAFLPIKASAIPVTYDYTSSLLTGKITIDITPDFTGFYEGYFTENSSTLGNVTAFTITETVPTFGYTVNFGQANADGYLTGHFVSGNIVDWTFRGSQWVDVSTHTQGVFQLASMKDIHGNGYDYLHKAGWGLVASSALGTWTRETTSSVPEPATMLLLGLGMVGLAGVKKKFKN